MKATTIKLDGELLQRLERSKPKSLSVSGYVRGLIESDLQRQTMASSAREYQQFLTHAKDERVWLEDWTGADLANPPRGDGT